MSPEEIAAALRQAIRVKELPPGSALIQEELAQRFGVSRNPVREALRMLVTDGLVDMRPGDGATVRRLSPADLAELYDLRLAIEPLIAKPIMDEARPRDIDELQRMAQAIESTTDLGDWIRLNFDFHAFLFALSNRPRTEAMLNSLLSAVQPYSSEHIGQLGGRTQASAEHLEMIDAIRRRDDAALAGLFVSHLSAAKERLLKHYGEAAQPSGK